jgi:hypothetical protein
MDDYNVNCLSEAKNEYCARLLNTLTPLLVQGLKSIYDEAVKLCDDNEEYEKYLMTFQNFLTRVPQWNNALVLEECDRIIKDSHCNYLEDLIACVHITHLKILTSVRVSQKQKKIDIDIPKLSTFIHNCYINFARKLYENVYLFEKDVMPLQYQKNMRECELICRESILTAIRNNIPVEKMLRAYIDETVDEEIVEELVQKNMSIEETEKLEKEIEVREEKREEEELIKEEEEKDLTKNKINLGFNVVNAKNLKVDEQVEENSSFEKSMEILTEKLETVKENIPISTSQLDDTPTIIKPSSNISFNDNDNVLDMGTNKQSVINAPKTLERLDQLAKDNEAKRKADEMEYNDDDNDDDGPLKIGGDDLKLTISDIHDLNHTEIKPPPSLDVEVLS